MRRQSVACFLVTLAAALQAPFGPAPFSPAPAHALTAVEISFEQLVLGANLVVVGTARESHAVWEDTEGPRARRIVTYTRFDVERVVDGTASTEPVWVRTLGGTVGDIGQRVEGEIAFSFETSSLLFLRRRVDATHSVVGMSQGHFPVEASATSTPGARRLLSSPHIDGLVARIGHTTGDPSAARVALLGRSLDDVSALIRAERDKHAKK